MDVKVKIQCLLYSQWRPIADVQDGYCVIMPIPEDLPFLATLALEGLQHIHTDHCGQIVIVGDGHSNDRGKCLAETVSTFHDSRIEIALFSRLDRYVIRGMPSPHWLTVIYGTNHTRYSYAFLHDSDAFFLESDCIERTYNYCRNRSEFATGVCARWDNFFKDIDYQIPGTWQMMFHVPWLRRHKPWMVRGRKVATPHGMNTFDTLLYPQYLDYGSGMIGIMANPPRYVHFNGTIVTYRAWKRANGRQVVDELCRLLLLSILENILPATNGKRMMPSVDELACGLNDSTRSIRYDTLDCARNYGEFREQMEDLCGSPIFAGERAETIHSLLIPFDSHFARIALKMGDKLEGPVRKFRQNGLA